MIDEIEDVDGDINNGKLLFIGDNKENFNFNTFNMPLNFLLDIYTRKISLKEAEFNKRNLERNNRRSTIWLWTKKEKRKRRNKWSIDASKWFARM